MQKPLIQKKKKKAHREHCKHKPLICFNMSLHYKIHMCYHPNKDVREIILNICLFWNIYHGVFARVCVCVCVHSSAKFVCIISVRKCVLITIITVC